MEKSPTVRDNYMSAELYQAAFFIFYFIFFFFTFTATKAFPLSWERAGWLHTEDTKRASVLNTDFLVEGGEGRYLQGTQHSPNKAAHNDSVLM